jgi:hypothetical protein
MDTAVWIVIAVAAVVIVLIVLMSWLRARRRHTLRDRFGPEYDRALETHDRRRGAERDLAERAKQRDELDIRPLSAAARERFAGRWSDVQASFVDQPRTAVGQADELVRQVMHERGYPVDDFGGRADLVSVDYPQIVDNYREAHDIAERNRRGDGSTEELRRAVVLYRSLFDQLLEPDTDAPDADRPDTNRPDTERTAAPPDRAERTG